MNPFTPAMEGKTVKIKTYVAYTMAEALSAVKRDLGENAVILHTRSFKRGGFFGLGRKTVVEVSATPSAERALAGQASPGRVAATSANAPKLKLKTAQAQRAYGAAQAVKPSPSAAKPASLPSVDDRERTRRLAMALQEAHERKSSPSSNVAPIEAKVHAPSHRINPAPPANPPERAARRFVLSSPDAKPAAAESIANHASTAQSTPSAASILPQGMHEELSAIKQMVGHVLQRQAVAGAAVPAMPSQLFDMYLKLISQDISNELADQVVNAVREELRGEQLENAAIVREAVLRQLASLIPVCSDVSPKAPADGRPLTIALIGPTGVGKTTTLAKLAATFKLRYGKNVGLVTADTYRIAAVDQLRTYAEIIGLPLQVALTPAEMKRATDALRDKDIILIDTAGRSQKDSNRISELKRFIAAANPHEIHLVLSGTASEKVLLEEAKAFSHVGIHKIVLTKLDEAVSFGMLVNAVRQIGKQLSFITTGQEVPDHIESAAANRLAELVLGSDSLASAPSFASNS